MLFESRRPLMQFIRNAFLVTLMFCAAAFANAQNISPLKNGDKMVLTYVTYGEKGADLGETKREDVSAEFMSAGTGYAIKFANGRVENYDEEHALYSGVTARPPAPFTLPKDEIFRWMPKDMTVGKKAPVSYMVNTKQCGMVKRTFPDVEVKEGVRQVKVEGALKDIPVFEVSFKGTWTGSCGTAKYEHYMVFSSQFNFLVEYKSLNYLPSGPLFQGSAKVLTAVN